MHNAVKFTPVGGVISLSASPVEDAVQFQVRDTGVGVCPENLPRVFERFFKTDRARHTQVTGLGLAIAKHIVQAQWGADLGRAEPRGRDRVWLYIASRVRRA